MDIKQLKYFLNICENKSFSEAAKRLYITEQGLSKAIKNLEHELQFPLFYRDGVNIKLTNYGACLKEKSKPIVEEFDLLKFSINQISNIDSKKVKIGYSSGIFGVFLYKLMLKFKKDYPDIELDVTEYSDLFCEQAVYTEEVDLGITIAPIDKSKFNSHTIISEKICLIVNSKNRLSSNKEIDFSDIKNEKIITPNKSFKIYHNFINMCKKSDFEPNIFFTTANINLYAYIIKVNNAVGIGPYINHVPFLKFIPFKDNCYLWEICLINKKGTHLSDNSKCVIDYILNNFKK